MTVVTASPTSLDAIVSQARAAFEQSRDASYTERAGWLKAIANALEADRSTLVRLAQEETHLPQPRLEGELTRTVFQLNLLASEIVRGEHLDATIDHAEPGWGMGPRPDLRRVNRPLGVVAVFGASNFPFAFSVMGGDSASALAAGCAVVHKGHPDHPRLAARTAEIVVRSLASSGAPDGLFALVSDPDAGVALVEHPTVQAVGFTGSTAGGRALFDRAAARPEPIPFYGELGSTNPVFVTEAAWSARRDEIIRGYVASATLGMGQFCTKPGFLVIPDTRAAVDETFGDALAGVPRFPFLSERLREGFTRSVDDLVRDSPAVEAARSTGVSESGPVLLALSGEDVLTNPAVLEAEMFGPASVVVREADPLRREQIASALTGQLTATIWAEEGDDIAGLVRILEQKAGRMLFNDWPTGVTVSYAQHHGGPYPASTASGTTSVGTAAITRFLRPVAYQGFADSALPPELRGGNPLGIRRRVDGEWQEPSDKH